MENDSILLIFKFRMNGVHSKSQILLPSIECLQSEQNRSFKRFLNTFKLMQPKPTSIYNVACKIIAAFIV